MRGALGVIDLHLAIDAKDQRNADLRRVRDAVAELIEADKEYDAAFTAVYEMPSGYEPSDAERDRFSVSDNRRAAALARIAEL